MITCEGKVAFVRVWKPEDNMYGASKLKFDFLFPKKNKKGVKEIKTAIRAAIKKGVLEGKFTAKQAEAINFKSPIRDDSEECKDNVKGDKRSGFYSFSTVSDTITALVDAQAKVITNRSEFYSGCFCRLNVSFYAYSKKGVKGVAVRLEGIMKTRNAIIM